MIVLVCGGRDWGMADYQRAMLRAALDRLHAEHNFTLLVEGGALGTDSEANVWAQTHGIHVATVSSMWGFHGRRAGPLRNIAMLLLQPKLVIAFPGGRGTEHMAGLAEKNGIPVVRPLAGSEPCTTPKGPRRAKTT